MIERAGGKSIRLSSASDIESTTKIIIPGVGAFDHGMESLHGRGLIPALEEAVFRRRIPVLGICLGMQMMCRSSEEGLKKGLGWIDAEVCRFPTQPGIHIPHMGWNTLQVVRPNQVIPFNSQEQRFYFVHSYRVNCKNPIDIIATATYGDKFVAGFEKENIIGVQFHPEKSHKFGMDLFHRFVKI